MKYVWLKGRSVRDIEHELNAFLSANPKAIILSLGPSVHKSTYGVLVQYKNETGTARRVLRAKCFYAAGRNRAAADLKLLRWRIQDRIMRVLFKAYCEWGPFHFIVVLY
jgi:hypothetical protein